MNNNDEEFFKITTEICVVFVKDNNREEEFRCVDLGNYYIAPNGEKVLLTSRDMANKYGHLVKEKIYVQKRKTFKSM